MTAKWTGTTAGPAGPQGPAGTLTAQQLSDLAAVEAAVSAATGGALAKRDGNGRMQAVDPAAAADVATKNYTDAQGSTVGVATWTNTASATVTPQTSWFPGLQQWTLAQNLTITAFPTSGGALAGRAGTVTIEIIQAASGGPFSVTWPSGIKWAGGAAAPTMPTTASARLVVDMWWDGVSTWHGTVVGTF